LICGKVIGTLDEAGMEICHKVLCAIGTQLFPKISQQANLVDTIQQIQYASDSMVSQERKKASIIVKLVLVLNIQNGAVLLKK